MAEEKQTEAEPPKFAQITEAQLTDLMAKANQFDDLKRAGPPIMSVLASHL